MAPLSGKWLAFGLLLGLLAAYAPSSSVLAPVLQAPLTTGAWSESFARYQARVPIAQGHGADTPLVAEEERVLRMSDQAFRRKEESKMSSKRDAFNAGNAPRVEPAGAENAIPDTLPVYLIPTPHRGASVEQANELGAIYGKIGEEVASMKPRTVVIVNAQRNKGSRSTTPSVQVSRASGDTLELVSAPEGVSFAAKPDPQLATRVAALIRANDLEVTKWDHGLDPAAWTVLRGIFGAQMPDDISVLPITMPVGSGFTREDAVKLGKALEDVRDEDVVIMVVGNVRSTGHKSTPVDTSFDSLFDMLHAHTLTAREDILLNVFRPTAGPNKPPHLSQDWAGVFIAAGAAAASPGESVRSSGAAWRFGDVPLRVKRQL